MRDFLAELQSVGLTALFNPTFLFLLVVLFFLGRLVGWMVRSVNLWKFLALAYFGVFLFRPLQEAGLIIGGVFILGVASMYTDLFREIFNWSGGVRDIFFAMRSPGAYQDISRLEREIEELRQELRATQAAQSATGDGSAQQQAWRAQSQARKTKTKTGSQDGGRGSGGSNSKGSRSAENPKPRSKPKSRPTGGSDTRTKSRSSSAGSQTRSSRSTSQSQTKSKQASPSSSQSAGSGAGQKASSSNQSSRQNTRSTSGGRGAGQQKGTGGSQQQTSGNSSGGATGQAGTMSPALRDSYLQALELAPGKTYTPAELKDAWRKMAFKTHPDRGGSAAAFATCLAAYRALT